MWVTIRIYNFLVCFAVVLQPITSVREQQNLSTWEDNTQLGMGGQRKDTLHVLYSCHHLSSESSESCSRGIVAW